ncbi:hypothetical protein SLEP1_g40681 [Rubroshorea leprosula]|uniref:BZIP domain-containing protein n=1 Tax=Rubroshorea leprosula TaxID=152421 RepID=A0AAV5L4N5_9ROSI|nr:hypothetical protein SLEP1_g40681 [Rubroshorea leprosula]
MDPNHGGGQDEQNSQNLGGYFVLGQDVQNWGISVEDYPLAPLDSIRIRMSQDDQGVAGAVQHRAPQGTSDELKSLNGFHLQSWNFGNQSVAGAKQPASGALEFADNEIQTLSSYDKELNVQQFDQLPVDILGIQQLWMTQLGQPGALNSMDQVSLLPVSGTQLLENQMPAAIQPLIQQQFDQTAATANSRSTRTIGESNISEAERKRLVRKRECDRRYRTKEKVKKQKLEVENEELRAQIEERKNVVLELERERKSNHLKLKSCELKITELEAEKEDLKEKFLLLEGRHANAMSLLGEMKSMMKQMGKQGIKKPKRKLKKQVMMAETVEDTKNDT